MATAPMTFHELAPPAHLRDHVVCFWHRPGGAPASGARILPDGCIDVLWIDDCPPVVAGPMTVSAVPMTSAGEEIIGVRFRPGAASALLGVSARELRDGNVPLRDIWPHDRYEPWAEAVLEGALPARLEAISVVITKRLERTRQTDSLVADAARWLAAHPSGSVATLTRDVGLSTRQIRRRFDDAIGYGPKTLQRILRLQRLLWLASQERGAGSSLAALAFAAGFADQAHMTRDVRALAGVAPGQLLAIESRSAVSDLFKTRSP